MCRILAYAGAPIPLSKLLLDAPHSLKHQSQAAREMDESNTAGDGWGVGWFPNERNLKPGLLKAILPLWADENARTVSSAVVSGSIIAHVRHASPSVEVC